jgi:phosphoesterase RecJ-like protein
MGKETILCSAGPFERTEIKQYERFFVSAPEKKDGDRAIIVDCSTLDRIGGLEPFFEGLPVAVIDHHETKNSAGLSVNAVIEHVNYEAPSATFLIFQLIQALGMEPDREEARLLFFGLCTDTGFFRHLDRDDAAVFEVAASLVRYGANPKDAFTAINGGRSLDSRRLMGLVLNKAESFFDGKLILSSEEYEETRRFGLESRDSDSIYQLFQSVAGMEAIVIIRQESPENCTVGFRSRDWVDVGSIAGSFGGGGHKNAAGLSIKGTIAGLKPLIIEAFKHVFQSDRDN